MRRGLPNTVDPVGGSEYIETLTDQHRIRRADEYIEKIDAMGGALQAIESGYMQTGNPQRRVRVSTGGGVRANGSSSGVNRFRSPEPDSVPTFRASIPDERARHKSPVCEELRADRSQSAVEDRLHRLRDTARGRDNLMPAILDAAEHYATVEEISDAMRSIFGTYTEGT